ncbi:hypothetical protein J7F01_41200 [Streptomyces sp. ISL-22]|uniref:hypothetical protein n=1 Tax=unclassified Streptomyces TaxID=2593676 RepID=UPI001BEA48A8|nr:MULTISPECIES: hypothetical protein [unclassified Streptomyces]MBT2423449.1 hypothetical protein [Streptomyces sp. ISL-24]MBT2438408.1 hypothetical protein [Streptomyces sp. ISL-22]
MMTRRWQRLSHREAGLPPAETLYGGVAPHLEQALRDWIEQSAATDAFARRVMVNMKIVPSWTGGRGINREELAAQNRPVAGHRHCMVHLGVRQAAQTEHERRHRADAFIDPVTSLAELLSDARSAYQVRITEDGVADGLERIVDATVTEAATQAGDAAEASGRQIAKARLRSAWHKAYALNPDPGGVQRHNRS